MGQPAPTVRFGVPTGAVSGDGRYYSNPALWGINAVVNGVNDVETVPSVRQSVVSGVNDAETVPAVGASGGGTLTALQDWINRSTAAGVVQAIRFASASTVTPYIHTGTGSGNVVYDPNDGIIGDGCLRINVPSTDGANSGAWRAALNAAWASDGQGFGSTPFHIQFRVKLGPNRLRQTLLGGGFKVMNLSEYLISSPNSSRSHASNEIVLNNGYWYGVPQMYREHFTTGTTDFNRIDAAGIHIQTAVDHGSGANNDRYCLYNSGAPSAGCWDYEELAWFTVYLRIKIVNYGGAGGVGNELDMYVAREGETSYTQLQNLRDFEIGTDGALPNGINGIWLLPYDTNRTSADYDTYQKYDQLIVSTNPIACPLVTAKTAPSWFMAMGEKTWFAVAASATVDAVKPTPNPGGNIVGVMNAWGGGVIDTLRYELQLPAQGGHADYEGNEVYALALNVETPGWQRHTTPRYAYGSSGLMDDGSPRSNHGQAQLVYSAVTDRTMIIPVALTSPLGDSSLVCHSFNRGNNTWTQTANAPSGFDTGSGPMGGASYDPHLKKIWAVSAMANEGGVSLSLLDPVANSFTTYSYANLGNTYCGAGYSGNQAFARSRRILTHISGSVTGQNGSLRWIDVDNRAAGWKTPTVSGSPPTGYGPGFVWHEKSRCYVGWDGSSGNAVIKKLTVPVNPTSSTWAWTDVAPSGSNTVTPSNRQAQGTFGRFNLIEDFGGSGWDALVLVNSVTGATFVYKLPKAGL